MYFFIVDGNSIISRAYYAIKTLSNNMGIETNGIYGFINIFMKFLKQLNPKYVAIAFDVSRKTFRTQIYNDYKKTRKETPSNLIEQIKILQEFLELAGYKIVKCFGYEADDILGTLSKVGVENGLMCGLLTGDKDAFQLINEHTSVFLPTTKASISITNIITIQEIKEKYNIKPGQFIDVKALMGDDSDNIPGCKGIGEKTAVKLVSKYNDIETIFSDIDMLETSARVKLMLKDNKSNIFLSKALATIHLNAPINCNLCEYIPKQTDKAKLLKKLFDFKMISVIDKINNFVPHMESCKH